MGLHPERRPFRKLGWASNGTGATRPIGRGFRLGDVGRPGQPLFGWVVAGVGDADDTRRGRAQVRDSSESLEVVVVQRRADRSLATLPWLTPDKKGR